ncbi:MAG TPA: glycosyltransferase family 2 protein [Terracidiphilus sp.]|nr:glycosyltransferase family 2 protein [Terracidiphilus sp.]
MLLNSSTELVQDGTSARAAAPPDTDTRSAVKLSIIVLCWNDRRVIADCMRSIYETTHSTELEVIVSDNGSTDGSIEFLRSTYPAVRVIENGRNLRFARGNNVGISSSRGEYVLILNPDTIIHEGTLDKMVAFADRHSQAGAFGCRVLNPDGSYQVSARPFAACRNEWIAALYLRSLGRLHRWFTADSYPGWKGTSEREVDWVSGCFIFVRGALLKSISGFDEQFFYYYEDMDLCRRIRHSGYPILYSPDATITHLGGQSTKGRFPALAFILDGQITRYLYYNKYFGRKGLRAARHIALVSSAVRWLGYRLKQFVRPTEANSKRVETFRGLFTWHLHVDPVRLVDYGEEPRLHMDLKGRVAER